MNDALKIGILFSTTGPYGSMGRDARDGADFAMAEYAGVEGLAIEPVFFDPHADLAAYLDGARHLLRAGCRHIVGTITSAARKEVIPLVEKHDGLLWYMCPYEGFEANENVIYVGGCPNQHLLPLFEHLIPRYGARPYLVGANYVWGWEMNRLARELITNAGGEVLGERYLPLEETAVERIVAEIAQRRPSFILNNLIGPSSYAFLEAIKALGNRDPAFRAENCPVVSCDLMECELDDIAAGAAAGQLCAASYFDSIATSENAAFKARVTERHSAERRVSSVFASAYTAVRLCVDAIVAAGGDEPDAVRRELYNRSWPTLFGALSIDRETNHAALPFHLGRINADNGFDVVASRPPLAADPYLTGRNRQALPRLRVVS
ncbi:UNVERIFIED_ORG: ABC-type branched-subunit amino acid transport system substrate-binding protein [Rhizobium sophorae]|uniref:transporter substrate-binding protein n=1 Tax=Rhizobium leguminosarum TaxID=384 RepID=UPI000E0F51EE|nr:transporter substrate-binding protein [Rhizobium leguminosarum]MBB4526601.1 branched-chain amino acid transport system substrate-binding protein [Rhizobium leguminosarum]MBY5496938.1 transporter substrate-binding domain-containing protein [Rhizobium leguminosarum]MDH6663726.1 ABC-type branched-subunit amino acid transport system substrate-binding protein [Rhizobium sophorae]NKJ97134.1 transporter substrate-binding protein [Rhizobium leguminosarum bv. viciae]